MVKLNKIYTRTGDDGTTGLGDGVRVKKNSSRIEAIGAIDELNAHIGAARLEVRAELDAKLARIQNELFDIGADLSVPAGIQEKSGERLRISSAQISALEQDIDALNAGLESLKSFVLPGGTKAAAALHLARTITRRAERILVALAEQDGEQLNVLIQIYINRLSDFLFVAARTANDNGNKDVLWQPGKTTEN